jgi:hypothetical protein
MKSRLIVELSLQTWLSVGAPHRLAGAIGISLNSPRQDVLVLINFESTRVQIDLVLADVVTVVIS